MNPAAADIIEQQSSALISVRRHLHQHPELSGSEFETTKYLAEKLDAAGVAYRIGPDSRGLIVDLGDQSSNQRLALRADLDALAIQDAKNVEYRSGVEAVMHACGHDVHSSILLAAVITLHRLFEQSPPSYAIRAIFQPEEETAVGAKKMIEFGALEGVSAIVGAHVDPHREVGLVGIRSGVICAHCDEIFVDVRGRGGHAARPSETIDPVELAVRFISDCYQAVPRYGDDLKVILSFTMLQGGHRQNVIPDEVKIGGTMRSMDDARRNQAIESMKAIAAKISEETSAEFTIRFGMEVPSVVGDESTTKLVRSICEEVLGHDCVQDIAKPSMGGEDFAFYSRQLPAAFIRLGCKGENTGHHPLHNCQFDVDEDVLSVGAKVMTHVALNFFEQTS